MVARVAAAEIAAPKPKPSSSKLKESAPQNTSSRILLDCKIENVDGKPVDHNLSNYRFWIDLVAKEIKLVETGSPFERPLTMKEFSETSIAAYRYILEYDYSDTRDKGVPTRVIRIRLREYYSIDRLSGKFRKDHWPEDVEKESSISRDDRQYLRLEGIALLGGRPELVWDYYEGTCKPTERAF